MNATPKPFSGLIQAMNTPTRPTAAPTRHNAVRPDSSAARQRGPIGREPDQRPTSGPSVAEYFAHKEARGEHGTFDGLRLGRTGRRS